MEQTKGILTPRDIDEEGRYYFVRKAMDAGNVVRLKNGVYATQEGLANTMVDVERIVPGGVLCLYSAWEYYGLTTQLPGSIPVGSTFKNSYVFFVFSDIFDVTKIFLKNKKNMIKV